MVHGTSIQNGKDLHRKYEHQWMPPIIWSLKADGPFPKLFPLFSWLKPHPSATPHALRQKLASVNGCEPKRWTTKCTKQGILTFFQESVVVQDCDSVKEKNRGLQSTKNSNQRFISGSFTSMY
jgi:hypothetical protein